MSEARAKVDSIKIGSCVLVAVFVFLFHLPFAQNTRLFDDSADYARASEAAFVPTWLNTNSASLFELFRLRSDPGFRARPWDYLYRTGDNIALRHFHAPVSFYAQHFLRATSPKEQPQRLLVSVVSSVTCASIVFFLVDFAVYLPVAVLIALFAGVQSRYIEVSVDPTPHAWYMLFALVFLFSLSRYLSRRTYRDLYFAAVVLGLAVATLEFSVSLFACLPIALCLLAFCSVQPGLSLPNDWKLLGRAFAAFLAVTFLLWPGGWLRGGYLETYGVLAATVVFKNSTAFGGKLTCAGIYNSLFSGHEALLVLTLLCFVGILALLASRRASAPMIVFASYNLVAFALGVANHFRLSTYISEFLLFFIVATGLVAADIQRAFLQGAFVRRMSVLALSLLLIVGCFSEWRSRESALAFRPWLEPIFSGIREKVPTGETILVTDDWEALWLYLPQYGFEPTEAKDSAVPRSPSSSVQTKYFLFDGEVQPPNSSFALATFSTYSGRTEVLWKLAPQRGSSDGEAQHPQ